MAYQENSYGPRSTYAGPTNNAGHFPHSHSQSHQQQSPFYPNPYPQSNQSNASPPHPPLPSYIHPQPSEAQTYQPQRLPYGPNQFHFQNGRAPLMQPPISLPDDHFKKPYLPQQQYINHAQPPANFIDHQRQKSSSAVSDLAPGQQAYSGASATPKRLHSSSLSYPPTSTMTATATPANPPSTQSTPTSEVPSQSADPALQAGGLSSLDQQRVDALLQVNNLLLQEVTILQKVGFKPSPQSPQQTAPPNASPPQATPAPPTSAGDPTSTTQNQNNSATKANPTVTPPTTTASTTATAPQQQQSLNTKKYVEFMTRIKTNIVFLVSISDQAKDKPRLPYPTHLEAPPLWLNPGNEEGDRQLDMLRDEYSRLRGLWPDWKPEVRKPQPAGQQAQQQQQQQQQQQMQVQMPMQPPQVQQQV